MSLSSELQCRPEEPSDAKAEMAVGTSTPLSWASFDCAWAMDTQVRIWVFPDPISPWGSQKPIVAHECIGQMLNVLLNLFFSGCSFESNELFSLVVVRAALIPGSSLPMPKRLFPMRHQCWHTIPYQPYCHSWDINTIAYYHNHMWPTPFTNLAGRVRYPVSC